jgi:membrane-associated phospholipid phosphatase
MRDLEHGKAMPSGDSAAGAFFLGIYMLLFGQKEMFFICLPLVCLGRVYTHCHWIGDTIAGSTLGYIVAYEFFNKQNFIKLGYPLYVAVC